jgi:hypothetical protein
MADGVASVFQGELSFATAGITNRIEDCTAYSAALLEA